MALLTPRISVIIPAYNAEETIQRACLSALSQSWPKVEVVAVNDGSGDCTGEILDNLACEYPNLRVIHQCNGGVSNARNTGLDSMTGEIVCFLDSDDELLPGALESMAEKMEKTGCQLVAGRTLLGLPNGQDKMLQYPEKEWMQWKDRSPLEHALLSSPMTHAVWGKLYRKEIVEKIRFVEGKSAHEDGFFLFQVLTQDVQMELVREYVIRYYLTADSTSRAEFDDRFLDIFYFAQSEYEIIETTRPQWLPLAKNMLVKNHLAFLGHIPSVAYTTQQKQSLKFVRQNCRWFIPSAPMDTILFLTVLFRMFWAYKLLHQLRNKVKALRGI